MNPLDLPGPQFLVFYAVVGLVTLWVSHVARSRHENGRAAGLGVSDPYLVAYLRGGPNEALRVATVTLIDRGLLVEDGASLMTKPDVGSAARHPLEQQVLEIFARGNVATAIFLVAPAYDTIWHDYDDRLTRAGLLPDEKTRARRRRRLGMALIVLLGLAGAKLVVALSRGRTNVLFLVILAIVFSAITVVRGNPRHTIRGRAVVDDLRRLFRRLKDRAGTLAPGGGTAEVALLAAVFGVGALPASRFPYVRTLYPKAGGSGASCGSSCGSSCGGGGGGGCGGCGGGD